MRVTSPRFHRERRVSSEAEVCATGRSAGQPERWTRLTTCSVAIRLHRLLETHPLNRSRAVPIQSACVAGDVVASSWCLRLHYTTGITVDGNPFVGGLGICAPDPAPRVSGAYTADCEHNILYVFGGMRRAVGGVEVVRADGRAARAYVAA